MTQLRKEGEVLENLDILVNELIKDAVVFLTDYADSKGALLEKNYCDYIGKKVLYAQNY